MRKGITIIVSLCCFLAYSQTLFALGKTHLGELYYMLNENARTAEVTASIDRQGMSGNYPELDSIVIPDTVSYLGVKYAVKSIGDYAFSNSENLTKVVIPDHIQSIGSDAFNSCKNLTSVTLPQGVDTLFRVFSRCFALRRITIPESVTSVLVLFYGCINLDSVVLPPNITQLIGTFADCRSLQYVSLPDSLKTIGRMTFSDCQSLRSITIPSNVKEVSFQAFKDCSALDTIRVLAIEPPIATSQSFSGMDKSACVLLVPAISVDLYRGTDGWKDFNVQPLDSPTDINNTFVDTKAVKRIEKGHLLIERDGKYYNAQGILVR